MSFQENRKNTTSTQERNENLKDTLFSQKKNDRIFINRRNSSRREEIDLCKELPLDLYSRKRRKSSDRRNKNKTLADDYFSFSTKK
mgnify:CR=1 FL=1